MTEFAGVKTVLDGRLCWSFPDGTVLPVIRGGSDDGDEGDGDPAGEAPAAPEASAGEPPAPEGGGGDPEWAADLWDGVPDTARQRLEGELRKARQEAADSRVALKPYRDVFADDRVRDAFMGHVQAGGDSFVTDLVGFLDDIRDPARAKTRLEAMLQALSGQDAPNGQGPQGDDEDALSFLTDPDRFNEHIAGTVEAMLAERDQEQQLTQAAERIVEKAEKLGYERGSVLFNMLLADALEKHDGDLDAAHEALTKRLEAEREARFAELSEEPATNPGPQGGTTPGQGREIKSLDDAHAAAAARFGR